MVSRNSLNRRSWTRTFRVTELEARLTPAFYTVTGTGDNTNSTPSGGTGAVGTPFLMSSLRGAILAANAAPGADTITLPAGTYTLSLANAGGANEDANMTGDLDVTDSLTLNGAGSASTILQAGTTSSNGIDKVLAINPICDHTVNYSMSGLTVRNGRNTQPFGAADFSYTGAGMDWCGFGSSTCSISNCVFTNNTNVNGYGGGLNIDEIAPAKTTVTITNTAFTNNTTGLWGGGINVFGDNLQLSITGSTISNNTTLATGGGGAQGGGVNIRVINQNDGDGAPAPSVLIDMTNISGNTGRGFGGGVCAAGAGSQNITIQNSAIVNNTVLANGVTSPRGGGMSNENALTTTLTNVLIANNTSSGGSGLPEGGGLSNGVGALLVRNTTISGNSCTGDAGGFHTLSGSATTTLTNVSITNNRSDSDGNGSGTGGGIRTSGASVILQNTIVDGNFNGSGSAANDIAGTVTANFSLVGNTTGATISGANNQLNVSARLAALGNDGGPSVGATGLTTVIQTHRLLSGSPALDGGSNALVPGTVTTDQRGTGFPRILDAADANTTQTVDIGAFEAHPSVEDIAAKSTNEDTALSAFSFNIGDTNAGVTPVISSVTATSSNTALVPNANLVISGSGSTRMLSATPAANQFGSTTITVTVAAGGQSMNDTFVLTVNPIADTPSVTGTTTAEDTQSTTGLVINRNAVDGAEVQFFKISNITGGTLFKNNGTTVITANSFISVAEGNAGLKFTPSTDLNSPAGDIFSFDVQASLDAAGTGISSSLGGAITVTEVNDTPTGMDDVLTSAAEDFSPLTIPFSNVLSNDKKGPANENGQALTITAVSNVVGGSAMLSGSNIIFTATKDFNGTASFKYTLEDNGTTNGVPNFKTSTAIASFTVTPVNDSPVLTAATPALTGIKSNIALAANTGDLITNLITGRINDVDGDPFGIAIHAVTLGGGGKWQFAIDGVTFADMPSVTTSAPLLLNADTNTRVRFVPSADVTSMPSITYRAWDRTAGGTEGQQSSVDPAGGGGTSAFSSAFESATIQVTDGVPPPPPTVTSPAGPIFVNSTPFNIAGTTEANALVKIYRDNNNDGIINGADAVVSMQQLTGGATSFSIATALNPNAGNNFLVTATDAAANQSSVSDVPTITHDNIPAKLGAAIQINDGSAQRSRVTSLTATFSELVILPGTPANAFTLTGPNGAVILAVNTSGSTPTQTVAKLTFSGTNTEFTSLKDGRYTLTVLANQITDNAGNGFDGDGNGTGGDNFVLVGDPATNKLFRLFGDSDGDGTVAANDFIQFRLALGGSNAAFDFDNDGNVSAADFIEFRLRFGGSV